jgi:hypothetical protein
MKTFLVLALCLPLFVAGCKNTNAPTPPLAPGAYNQVDQQLYGSLMAVQASLDNLKATVENPNTEASTAASIKPYLNQAILDYNIAEVAYQTYHAALATNPAASPSAVQTAITKVQTDLSQTSAVAH